jgi:hypothetical protein
VSVGARGRAVARVAAAVRLAVAGLAAVAALGAAACGGADDGGVVETPTTAEQAPASPSGGDYYP